MQSSPVTYTQEENLAIVTMDDGKANALSLPMIEGLVAAVALAEKEASAMVLTGRPDRFCAGFDLRIMMTSPDAARDLLVRGADLLMRLYAAKVPLVIASTGHALAGGALVLLTGDVRIGATGDYRIGLNEVQIGMPVPILAMELARDRLEETELVHATLLAKIYGPEDARRAGYYDVTTAPDAVLATARTEAARLASLSRPAFVATKERLRGKTIAHIQSTLHQDMSILTTMA